MKQYPETLSLERFFGAGLGLVRAAWGQGAGLVGGPVVPCRLAQCRLTRVWLECGGKTSPECSPRKEVPVGGDPDFYFVPNADHVEIHWTLEQPQNVTGATLTFYRAGSAAPIVTIDLDADAARAEQTETQWKGLLPGATPEFPHRVINAANGPYLVRLAIRGPFEPGWGEAWTFCDVRIHTVSLAWGADALLPADRDDIATEWKPDPDQNQDANQARAALKARVLAAETALLTEMRNGAAPTAGDRVLHVASSIFRHNGDPSTADMTSYKAAWGNGPNLPLVAKVTLKRCNDSEIDQEDAVGKLTFVWDCEDPRIADVDPTTTWVAAESGPKTRTFLQETFATNKDRHPTPSYNCPREYGGKHGDPAAPLFPAPPNGFPNAHEVPARRPDAAVTYPGAAVGARAHSAVIFQPSRMAGDTYQVNLYVLPNPDALFEAGDWRLAPDALRTAAAGQGIATVATSRFVVRRRVKVLVRKVAGANAWVEATVKAKFRSMAGIEIDFGTAPLDENAFLANDDALIETSLTTDTLPTFAALHFKYLIKHTPTGCALAFATKDEYETDVETLLRDGDMCTVTGAPGMLPGTLVRRVGGGWEAIACKQDGGATWLAPLGGAAAPANGTELAVIAPGGTRFNVGGVTAIAAQDARLAVFTEVKASDQARSDRSYAQLTSGMGPFRKFMADRARAYANAQLGNEVAAIVGQFEWVRSTDDFPSGSSIVDVSTRQRGIVLFSAPSVPQLQHKGKNPADFKTTEATLTHELGHSLFLEHMKNTAGPLAAVGNAAEAEDQHVADEACIMNYDPASEHFCGMCSVRMRGWVWSSVNRAWQVTPTLTLDGGGPVVFVKKPYLQQPPRALQVAVNRTFAGNGTLRCTSVGVSFYEDAACQVRRDLTGGWAVPGVQLARGLKLYVVADAAGAAMNNVTVTLTLAPPGGVIAVSNPASLQFTTVELTLDILKTRTKKGVTATAMPAADKATIGRYLAVQDPAHAQGRAAIVIHKSQPAAFTGKLVVEPVGGKIQLFKDRKHKDGRAALARWTGTNADIKPAGLELWVEGQTVSAANAAESIRIGVEGVDSDADRVVLTVLELKIEADVPVTPPALARQHPINAVMVNNAAARGVFPAQAASFDVDAGEFLVLPLEAAARSQRALAVKPLTFKAVVPGGGAPPLAWTVIRAKDDSSDIKKQFAKSLPTLRFDMKKRGEAIFNPEAVGTFHVVAFLDDNGTMKFDPKIDRAPFAVFNVVVVGLKVIAETSVASNAGFGVLQDADSVAIQDFSQASVNLVANVSLIGGGKKGRRGLDRAFVFWGQNVTNTAYPATYDDHGNPVGLPMRFVANPHQASRLIAGHVGEPLFVAGDPAPVALAMPIVDSGNKPGATGILPGTGLGLGRATNTIVDAKLGKAGSVGATDGPNRSLPKLHPTRAGAALQNFGWTIDFSAYLCICTGRNAIGPFDGTVPEPSLYSVACRVDWRVVGAWDLTVGGWDTIKPAVTIVSREIFAAQKAAADTTFEVGPPTMLTSAAFDGT